MTTENTTEAKVEFTLQLLSDGSVRVLQEGKDGSVAIADISSDIPSEDPRIANINDFEGIVLRAPEGEIQATARSTASCCWKPVGGRMVYVCPC